MLKKVVNSYVTFLSDLLLLMVLIHIEELIWIIPMEIEESRLLIFW